MVQNLMVKPRIQLLCAKLREHTKLRAKLENDTPCTSVLNTLHRLFALCESVARVGDTNLDDMLLFAVCERRVNSHFPKLCKLNEVVFKQQSVENTF